jgi:CheY-like chemotaxis protein
VIDLIIADFAMPEMNGVDLARTVSGLRPSLPFILTTGNGEMDPLKQGCGFCKSHGPTAN